MLTLIDTNAVELPKRKDNGKVTYIGEPGQEYNVLVTIPSLPMTVAAVLAIDNTWLPYVCHIPPGKARTIQYDRFPTSVSTGTKFIFAKPCRSPGIGVSSYDTTRRTGVIRCQVFRVRDKTPEELAVPLKRQTSLYGPMRKNNMRSPSNGSKFWENPGLYTTQGADGNLGYAIKRHPTSPVIDNSKRRLVNVAIRYDTRSNLDIRDKQQMPRLEKEGHSQPYCYPA